METVSANRECAVCRRAGDDVRKLGVEYRCSLHFHEPPGPNWDCCHLCEKHLPEEVRTVTLTDGSLLRLCHDCCPSDTRKRGRPAVFSQMWLHSPREYRHCHKTAVNHRYHDWALDCLRPRQDGPDRREFEDRRDIRLLLDRTADYDHTLDWLISDKNLPHRRGVLTEIGRTCETAEQVRSVAARICQDFTSNKTAVAFVRRLRKRFDVKGTRRHFSGERVNALEGDMTSLAHILWNALNDYCTRFPKTSPEQIHEALEILRESVREVPAA